MDANAKPQSPFLPGTKIQFAWDSTSLGYLKTCPRLYQYIMIDGWGHSDESIHLRFGAEYHASLQDYEMSRAKGIKHEDALHDTIQALLIRTWNCDADGNSLGPWTVDESLKAAKYKNRSSLIRSVIWYLDDFQDDAAKTYILKDDKPAVELSFRFDLDWGPTNGAHAWREDGGPDQPYVLCGHLDKVVSLNDALFVMDHKTTTTTPGSYYFDQYSPNNQMTLYTLAAQVVLDSPVKGVIINAMQLLVDSNRPARGLTNRTQDQLDEWLRDLHYWFALAENFATEGYWPMNDTSCDKFGGCRFREVCSKSPAVRDIHLKSKFEKLDEDSRWNPLRNRG